MIEKHSLKELVVSNRHKDNVVNETAGADLPKVKEMHPLWPSYPATSVIPEQVNDSVKQYIKDHPFDLLVKQDCYVNAQGVAKDIPKGIDDD